MKVWIKLLAGAILGLLLGFFLPADNQTILTITEGLARFAINIGRYAVVPMLFFSISIAVYELHQQGGFWGILLRAFLFIVISAALVISSGIFAVILFPPARIPIIHDEQIEQISLQLVENIMDVFPSNMFQTLVSGGVFLLPVCVFAFFLGMGLSYDKNIMKPVISLIDALSRVFYHIASFFSEILGMILIVLSAYWAFRYRALVQADFQSLIIILTVVSGVLTIAVFPLLLYFLKNKPRPWPVLYSTISSAIASFFSGDIVFSLPVMFRHTKESLGIRRRVNAVTLPFFATFGRAGSAMVAAISLILIIKSYSSLGISTIDILSIGIRAFVISFLLARHPGDGAYTALAVLCAAYGQGFEAGYLILKPIAFYLIAIGTFLDIMITNFGIYAVAKSSDLQEDKPIRQFI
ncbi:MAG: cation:dicarboxylase symporter family transporter [Treponema sp.]|jgi:Na+/H+-dicarboxylate symporter|nr:cation:dicarboxylase symporter family transporter [Treponema sp.]